MWERREIIWRDKIPLGFYYYILVFVNWLTNIAKAELQNQACLSYAEAHPIFYKYTKKEGNHISKTSQNNSARAKINSEDMNIYPPVRSLLRAPSLFLRCMSPERNHTSRLPRKRIAPIITSIVYIFISHRYLYADSMDITREKRILFLQKRILHKIKKGCHPDSLNLQSKHVVYLIHLIYTINNAVFKLFKIFEKKFFLQ